MTDKFQGHTKVDVKKLVVTSLASRRSIDISSVVTQIEIFGSIHEPTFCGSLMVYDGSSLLQNLPIIGEEILEIEFESPGRQSFNKLMHIFFPEDQDFDPNGTHISMKLHFATIDEFPGKITNINRAYKDNISNMVIGVLQDYTGTRQSINVEPSKGIEHINIPGWSAWKTLEFLRKRAVSQRFNSPYLLFENQEGYNFVSYEYLIDQRKHLSQELIFTADPFLPESGESSVGFSTALGRQYRNVDQLTIDTKSNTMKIAQEGGTSSRTLVFDFLDKSIRNVDTLYSDAKKIVKNPIGKSFNPVHTDNFFKTQTPTKRYMIPFDQTNPHALADQFGQKNMYISIFSETKIGFTTPGDSQLQPGDIFKFNMPARVNSPDPDKQLTGNYMIASLRHGISGSQMFTTIEAYKCGNEEKIV